jgi:hypothetical protein
MWSSIVYKIKEDEMGGTYSVPGRDEKCLQHFENLGIDSRMVLK